MDTGKIKQVASLSELLEIKAKDNICITEDIDCNGQVIPYIAEMFRGTIEGKDHTISNLIVSTEVWGDEQSIALFHYLSHAAISNLHFKNVRFEIDKNGYTPRIAGLCYECGASTLENVSMELSTSFDEEIALIYEANSVKISDLAMTCNGKSVETIMNM